MHGSSWTGGGADFSLRADLESSAATVPSDDFDSELVQCVCGILDENHYDLRDGPPGTMERVALEILHAVSALMLLEILHAVSPPMRKPTAPWWRRIFG
jgi:hypothetical protein